MLIRKITECYTHLPKMDVVLLGLKVVTEPMLTEVQTKLFWTSFLVYFSLIEGKWVLALPVGYRRNPVIFLIRTCTSRFSMKSVSEWPSSPAKSLCSKRPRSWSLAWKGLWAFIWCVCVCVCVKVLGSTTLRTRICIFLHSCMTPECNLSHHFMFSVKR